MAVALAARLLGIASRPIWYDEAFAILFSEKGPAAMARGTLALTGNTAADVHPLGYYTMLWLWMHAFGESLVSVRLLSVLAGLGVVAVIFVFARALFRPTTALAAGGLIALVPFQVHYAQEIRMYSFLCLWLVLATYSYWKASNSRGWSWTLCFGVFAALAQYTQNLAAFYLVALALWPIITRRWRELKVVSVGGFLALLLYSPWLVHLPSQFAKVEAGYWVLRPDIPRLVFLPVIFIVNVPVPDRWLPIAVFVGLAVMLVGLIATLRNVQERPTSLHNGLWMLYLAFAPAALMFLVSQWRPIYLERALLPSGAIFCIWLAWATLETRPFRLPHVITAAIIMIGFAIGLHVHLTNMGGIYGPFQALMRELENRWVPGDVIVHSNKLSMLPSVYFDRHIPQTYIADPPGSGADTLATATQETLGLPAQPSIESATTGARRVWFILFEDANLAAVQTGQPRHPQLTLLMQQYAEIEERSWGGLRVFLFTQKP